MTRNHQHQLFGGRPRCVRKSHDVGVALLITRGVDRNPLSSLRENLVP